MRFLETLYQRFAEFFPDVGEDSAAIHLTLSETRPLLYAALMEFRTQYDTWEFITNDRDLRLKAADIWKDQKEVFEGSMDAAWTDLMAEAASSGCPLSDLDPKAMPDWMASFRSSFPDEE